jgi:hypothetical protein
MRPPWEQKLETIETALHLNFTSGEGLDVVPFLFEPFFLRESQRTRPPWEQKLETIETALSLNFTFGEG